MDRDRFDELARLCASKRSRRNALAVILSSAILRHSSPVLAEPGGKFRSNQCSPGTDSDPCNNYRYPVSGQVTYEREVCCNNGFCSCGGDCNCGDECFQTGRDRTPKGCSAVPGRAGRSVARQGTRRAASGNWGVRRVQILAQTRSRAVIAAASSPPLTATALAHGRSGQQCRARNRRDDGVHVDRLPDRGTSTDCLHPPLFIR